MTPPKKSGEDEKSSGEDSDGGSDGDSELAQVKSAEQVSDELSDLIAAELDVLPRNLRGNKPGQIIHKPNLYSKILEVLMSSESML